MMFDLYLRGDNCVLHCDHKLLEPFMAIGIKIPKLKRWSMELADYTITFIHIKGKCNILSDTISRLKLLNIFKEPLKNPKVQVVKDMQQVVREVCATSIHDLGIDTLYSEQKVGQYI